MHTCYTVDMSTFGEQVTAFYQSFKPPTSLPAGVQTLNPYRDSAVRDAVAVFNKKYFKTAKKRIFLIGINPGKLGAGVTGIAFTDTEALRTYNIPNTIPESQEISAQFVYDMIEEYGGPKKFYQTFFLTNICPFGFIKGKVNYNYYDSAECVKALTPYIRKTFEKQLQFGAAPVAIVLGKGKNFAIIKKMNDEFGWFKHILPLEHPRFIMQYRRKKADTYHAKYLETLNEAQRLVRSSTT